MNETATDEHDVIRETMDRHSPIASAFAQNPDVVKRG